MAPGTRRVYPCSSPTVAEALVSRGSVTTWQESCVVTWFGHWIGAELVQGSLNLPPQYAPDLPVPSRYGKAAVLTHEGTCDGRSHK